MAEGIRSTVARVYKYGDYYIAGVSHAVPGYFQDVVFIYRSGNNWTAVSAERFRTNDSNLNKIREAIMYATHEDDLKEAVQRLSKEGIKVDEVSNPPFPLRMIEGRVKIQEEID
jgi:predicted transcriptional regulator